MSDIDLNVDEIEINVDVDTATAICANHINEIETLANSNNLNKISNVDNYISNINLVAGSIPAINSVADKLDDIDIDDINTVATQINSVTDCASHMDDITQAPINAQYAASAANIAHIWAEGTDAQVQSISLRGIHSAKGWAETLNNAARVISVKDFGAKGDGTTDDTSAIQQAINHSNAGDALLYFPSGTYICEDINVPNIHIVGNGKDTILKLKANSEYNLIKVTTSGAIIEGLTLDGNKANQTSSILEATANAALIAQIEAVPEAHLRYQLGMNSIYAACNNFDSAIKCGVYINEKNNVQIKNCVIKDFVNCGIAVKGCNNLFISQNEISNCGDGANTPVNRGCGILIFNSDKNLIDKNTVSGCTGFNILIQYTCYDNIISYNKISNSTYIGIGNGTSHRVKIIGNIIEGCVDNGIDMQQAHDVLVIGNTCKDNGAPVYDSNNTLVEVEGSGVNLFWGTDWQTQDQNAIITNNKFIKTASFLSADGKKENVGIYSANNGIASGTLLPYMSKHIIFSNNLISGGKGGVVAVKQINISDNIFDNAIIFTNAVIACNFYNNIFATSDLQIRGSVRNLKISGNYFFGCGKQSAGDINYDNDSYSIAFLTGNADRGVHMTVNIENNTFEMPDLTTSPLSYYKVLKVDYPDIAASGSLSAISSSNRQSNFYVKNNTIIYNGTSISGGGGINLLDIVTYPLFSVNTEKVICWNNVLYAKGDYIGNQRATMQYPAVLSSNKTNTSITYLPPYGYTKVALMSERTVTGASVGHSYLSLFEIYREPHMFDSNIPVVNKLTGIDTGNFTAVVDNTTKEVTFTTTTVPNDGVYIVILEYQSLY